MMSNDASEAVRKRWRPSFTTLILAGVFLGLATGLMFGEYCAILKPIGDAYVGLLQMTVLPFIMFSLIVNIGRLAPSTARRLMVRALAVLVGLWSLGLMMVMVMPLAFPNLDTGSFFSTTLLQPRAGIDLLELYIPANPFSAMANNIVPAVVVFSIGVGVAFIRQEKKEALLGPLSVAVPVLTRLNKAMVKLTPIGLFAIAASASGTMTVDEFGRLQAYLLTQAAGSLLLALWVLPMLVSAFTPLSYRQIVGGAKDALLTGAATGNVLIILPLLTENVKSMFRDNGMDHPDLERTIGVVLPVAFAFPNLGKILSLVFIPFTAWSSGAPLGAPEYPFFLGSGVLTYFGSTTLAVPFLLDLMRLPSDYFQLFLVSGIVLGRMGTILAAMHLVAFTIMVTGSLHGTLRLRRTQLITSLCLATVMTTVTLVGIRIYLDNAIGDRNSKAAVLSQMELLRSPVESIELAEAVPNPVPLRDGLTRRGRIRQRGVLRIGFIEDRLPFCYRNASQDLVGFDIDMAHRLADELGVTIEFVPITVADLTEHLSNDHIDVAMCGIAMTTPRLSNITFSGSYIDLNLALLVPDHRRHDFDSTEEIRRMGPVRIGLPAHDYLSRLLQPAVPEAVFVPIDDPREFFTGKADVEALIGSAEGGSAWTLLYPNFQVVRPGTQPFAVPLAYPIGGGDRKVQEMVTRWVEMKQKDGTLEEIYGHWILGRGQATNGPRWCVIRDVLGWID